MKRSLQYISILLLFCFCGPAVQGQRALDIMPFGIMPPLPVKFSAYIDDPDKISFMIKNNLFEDQTFFLEFKLLKEGNLFAHSIVGDRIGGDFVGLTVTSAGILNVTGSELQMLYSSISDFVILANGDNPAGFLTDGSLPEGSYELCFQAVDLETGIPLSESTCSMPFFIQNYPAPEFFPQPDAYETTVINPDAIEYLFQWRHDFISMGADGLHYELKMIELDGEVDSEITFVDDILLDNPGDVFFETNTMDDKLYLYDFLVDPPLTLNGFYAARVTIVDDQGQFRFENNGNSRPAILYYGDPEDLEEADAYHLTVHYPQAGDTLPFASTPLVLEFEQERFDFNRFNYTFSINGQGNLALGYTDELPYDVANPDMDPEDLSHLFLSGEGEVVQIIDGYERGQNYTLRAQNIEIGFPEEEDMHNLPPKSSQFVFGMPRPMLQAPSHNGTVEIETPLHFSFTTGSDPRTLIPSDGFVVDQTSNLVEGVTEGYSLHEKWVLQLCEDSTFAADKILFVQQRLLQVDSREMDYLELSEAIYKTEEISYDEELLEGDYFWRVLYLKSPFDDFSDQQLKTLTDNQIYHPSSIYKFTIAEAEPVVVEEESPDSTSDCNDICFLSESNHPLDMTGVSSRSSMSNQDVIIAGRFNVKIDEINFAGDEASGEGSVDVNFYGIGVTVKVEFSNIKINSSSQLVDGMIKAKKDQLEISDVLEAIQYDGINPEEMLSDEQADMVNNVLETYRQISALATGEPVGMPLGINYEYGNMELLFALTNMSFEPREAHCQILMNVPMQMFDEVRYLSLGASRICLTPGGFGPEATLHMVKAFHFDIGDFEEPLVHNAADLDNFTVSLLGPEDLDNQENIQATKLSFDCNGIKDFGIRGRIQFPTTMIRKEDAAGNLVTNDRAAGTFYFALGRDRIFEENETDSEAGAEGQDSTSAGNQRAIHMVAEIESMDQFQIVGLRDWSIGVERAYFDFSQLENAIGFEAVVPDDYSHTTFSDGEEEKHWQGFWLQQSKMRLPNFLNENGDRLEINVSNMIIDDEYFTANINVLPDLQGELQEGWTISLDSIWLQITESTFRDGGIKGEMGTPFIEENMEYTSILSYEDADTTGEDGELEYAFTVRPAETVAMPALMANANLTRETHIKLGYKANIMDVDDEDGKQLVIEAAFAGGIGISTEFISDQEILSALPFDLSLMQLPFLLKYSTMEGIDGYFGFSPEASQALSSGINEIQSAFSAASDDLESITSYLNDMENAEGGQGSMAGFSFGIREMGIGGNGLDSLNLMLHPFINLVVDEENGFGGAAKITMVGGYDSGSKKLVLKSPYVRGASVDIDAMFSGIGVKGGICFYNLPDDKGIKGFIDVALPIVRIQAKAQFGLKNAGQSNEYPYFFFQFLTRIASGIDIGNYTPIGSVGVSFYGLGGGIFYNMGYRSPALSGPNGGASPDGPAPADGAPIPDPGQDDLCNFDFPGVFDSLGAFRIEATIVLGTTTYSTPINMDITLGANIAIGSSAFGGSMDIEVKGYVLADVMSDREQMAPVYFIGAMEFGFIARTLSEGGMASDYPEFDFFLGGGLNSYVQIPPPAILPKALIKGDDPNCGTNCAGQMRFMMSTDRGNYFRAGTTEFPLTVKMGLGDLVDVRGKMYMMIGDGVPTGLPNLPDPIPSLLANLSESEDAALLNEGLANNEARQRTGAAVEYDLGSTGMGFAYGEQYSAEIGIESSILTAKLNAVVGFDANMSDVGEMCDAGGGIVVDNLDGSTSHWYAMGQAYAGIQGEISVKDILFGSEQVIPILDLGAVLIVSAGSPNPTYIHGVAGVYLNVFGGMIKGKKYFQVSMGERCVPPGMNDPFSSGKFIAYTRPGQGDQEVNPFTIPEVGFNIEMNKAFTFQEINDDGSTGNQVDYTPFLEEFYIAKGNTTIPCTQKWTASKTICKCETNLLQANTDYTLHVRFSVQGNDYTETLEHPFRTGPMPDVIPDSWVDLTYPVKRQRYFHQNERRKFVRFTQNLKPFFNTGIGMQLGSGVTSYAKNFTLRITDLSGELYYEKNITGQLASATTVQNINFPTEEWNLPSNKIYKLSIVKGGSNGLMSAQLAYNNLAFNQVVSSTQFGLNQRDSLVFESQLDVDEGNQGKTIKEVEVIKWYFKTSIYDRLSDKLSAGDLVFENGYFYIEVAEPFDVFDIQGDSRINPLVQIRHSINSAPYQGLKDDYLQGIINLKNELNSSSYSIHTGIALNRTSAFKVSNYSLLSTNNLSLLRKFSATTAQQNISLNLSYPKSSLSANAYFEYFTSASKYRYFDLDPGSTIVRAALSNNECGLQGNNSSILNLVATNTSVPSTAQNANSNLLEISHRYRIDFSPTVWTEYALKNMQSAANNLLWQQPYDPYYTIGSVVKKMVEKKNLNLWNQLVQQSDSFNENIGYNYSGALDHIRSHFQGNEFQFNFRYALKLKNGSSTYPGSSNLNLGKTYPDANAPQTNQMMQYIQLNW